MTAERPTCEKCGRLKRRNATRNGRTYYVCRHRGTPRDAATQAARPWCVACRCVMHSDGRRSRFRCRGCRATCAAGKTPRRLFIPDRPNCPACGLPMTARQAKGKRSRREFDCERCERLRREKREADALRVLAHVTSRLPGYLTPDEREDATHGVLLDLLAGTLRPRDLTPAVLRTYVSQARGMTSDRFKFVSLSEPTRDGRQIGDALAA
jgi:hypothetical protein